MRILIYIGDLITDIPSLFLGRLLAGHLQAEVTLLTVFSKDIDKGLAKKRGQKLLEQAREQVPDLVVKTRVRRGKVAKRILEEVKGKQHDMVVITASRIGGYPRKASVSRETLPKIPCSVVIAKNPRAEINRILMLTGGLKVSEAMIKIGAGLANKLKASVTLMHVTANVPSMYTGLETIEETLEELLQTDTPVAKHLRKCAQILDEHHVTSEIKLKHGEPVYEIVREVDGGEYDLIIIGASKATSVWKEWFLRNVTKDVVDLVRIPIMIVNQEHAEKIEQIGF
jgi:nucleotide-binding universal stress UspA family protein